MNKNITLAETLALSDIKTDGSFQHSNILDLRQCENGKARPIEEATLKKLQNRFISYTQMPTDMDTSDVEELVSLRYEINGCEPGTLVLTDSVSKTAGFFEECGISFTSKILYIVETGKGQMVQKVRQKPESIPIYGAVGN